MKYMIYCFAIEARNWLSNQSKMDAVLTPEEMFAASLIGPMGMHSGMGGGYESLKVGLKGRLGVRKVIKDACLSVYDKAE
jgi:hypothetical protein